METLIYGELVRFYPLLDPLEDHADEAGELGARLVAAAGGASSLLELGAGAGHGAHYVKRLFAQITLTDLSGPMLDLSRALNPDCEHWVADMRTMRLERSFDCVLVHDAICYLTTRAELSELFATAFAHLRPGGAALFVPDCTAESFCDWTEHHEGDDGLRSLRSIAWSHDPDPSDERHVTDYAFLLREDGEVRAVHDRHEYGLFPEAVWVELAQGAGFHVETVTRPLPDEYATSAYTGTMFLGRRP